MEDSAPGVHAMRSLKSSTPIVRLLLFTLVCVAVHGYHYGVDDAAIYLPAVLRVVHPTLYPYGAEFFESHARLSQFAWIVGNSVRLTRLDPALAIFLWHIGTIFLFLLAAWRLATILFLSERARWSAMLASAATLTVPVAGTALVIMDPYLTARSASTPLTMFAVAAWLRGNRPAAFLWIALAFLAHPLMAAYGLLCLGALAIPAAATDRVFRISQGRSSPQTAAIFPVAFAPITPAYRQAVQMRDFLYVLRWKWFEWIGVVAPVAILIGMDSVRPAGVTLAFPRACRALALLGIAATLLAGLICAVPDLEGLVWLQPMRALQLLYIVLFLLLGGLLGEYLLQPRSRLNIATFAALLSVLFATMFSIQCRAYPASRHIEWPGAAPGNSWVTAFQWARDHAPENAVFALDPDYIALAGEDQHGFRAIAQRSALADNLKDSGVVSVFPGLAEQWQREQDAQRGWRHFQLADFQRLARQYPVTWVVLQGPAPGGFACPYANQSVTICRIPGATGL
jgi:hypothetical protein